MRLYPLLFKSVLTRFEPERAHHLAATVIRTIGAIPGFRLSADSSLRTKALGLTFDSPFGLAAGFDKDATMIAGLYNLGFGHVEVGTVTRHAQPGNEKPRMFRLVKDRGLINRMGFNNHGSKSAARRVTRAIMRKDRPIIGANIGKSRITEVENATADYVWSAERLAPIADYLMVNVSSPNTPGLRGLQEFDMLRPLLQAVKETAGKTPVLVKIAPDMDDTQIQGIVQLAVDLGINGICATNTTISRDNLRESDARVAEIGAGGLSGAPLKARALEVLQTIKACAPADFTVISVGGVETAEDVLERLRAGADLVQGLTAFIYEGPLWAHKINTGLVRLGYKGNAAS